MQQGKMVGAEGAVVGGGQGVMEGEGAASGVMEGEGAA